MLLEGIFSLQWERLVGIIQELKPGINTLRGVATLMGVSISTVSGWKKSSQVDFKTVLLIKNRLNLTNEVIGFWLSGGDCPLRLQEEEPHPPPRNNQRRLKSL